jgi:hypothetical protein
MQSQREVAAEYERLLDQFHDVEPTLFDEAALADASAWAPLDLRSVAADERSPMSATELGQLAEAGMARIYAAAEQDAGAMPSGSMESTVCTAVDMALSAMTSSRVFGECFAHLDADDAAATVWGELGLGNHSTAFDAAAREPRLEVVGRVLQALVALEREALAEDAAAEQDAALSELRSAVAKAKAFGADDEAVLAAVESAIDETRTVHPYAWPGADDGASPSDE